MDFGLLFALKTCDFDLPRKLASRTFSYLNVAISSHSCNRTTFVLKSCEFEPQLRKWTLQGAEFTHSANVFCILLSPSSHKKIQHLAKVLRLPRNLYLALRKCCACHAIQILRNLRAAVPMVPSPRPFRDRPAPASVQASQPRWFAHCPEVQFTHSANVSASCYPPALLISAFVEAFSLAIRQSYLSVHANHILQSYIYIYVSSYLSLPYMSKQLARLVPILRKFLVKLPLMNTYLPLYFTIYVSIYIFLYLPISLYLHISPSLNIHISLSLPMPISLYLFI